MLFDFIGMQKLYLAMARADARPLAKALTARPPLPPAASGPRSCATTTS